MASITVTVPDPILNRVLDALAAKWNYNPAIDGTKAAFAKKSVANYLKATVKDYEATLAAEAARAAAQATAETDITIT